MYDENESEKEVENIINLNLSKRPIRGRSINSEDILNLKINLETTEDVSEFLSLLKRINSKAE